jgi:hypothetical protein
MTSTTTASITLLDVPMMTSPRCTISLICLRTMNVPRTVTVPPPWRAISFHTLKRLTRRETATQALTLLLQRHAITTHEISPLVVLEKAMCKVSIARIPLPIRRFADEPQMNRCLIKDARYSHSGGPTLSKSVISKIATGPTETPASGSVDWIPVIQTRETPHKCLTRERGITPRTTGTTSAKEIGADADAVVKVISSGSDNEMTRYSDFLLTMTMEMILREHEARVYILQLIAEM